MAGSDRHHHLHHTVNWHPRAVAREIRAAHGFNARIAVLVTSFVGTMACAYLFAALALISLPAAIASGSTIVIVAWIAQTFLQLVLLSVIMVGQRVQAALADERVERILDLLEELRHERD